MNIVQWFAVGDGAQLLIKVGGNLHKFDPTKGTSPGVWHILKIGNRLAASGNEYPEFEIELPHGATAWAVNVNGETAQSLPEGGLMTFPTKIFGRHEDIVHWGQMTLPQEIVRIFWPQLAARLDAAAAFDAPL